MTCVLWRFEQIDNRNLQITEYRICKVVEKIALVSEHIALMCLRIACLESKVIGLEPSSKLKLEIFSLVNFFPSSSLFCFENCWTLSEGKTSCKG